MMMDTDLTLAQLLGEEPMPKGELGSVDSDKNYKFFSKEPLKFNKFCII
jgi:hypothetical protein